jgi:hypothetical protein
MAGSTLLSLLPIAWASQPAQRSIAKTRVKASRGLPTASSNKAAALMSTFGCSAARPGFSRANTGRTRRSTSAAKASLPAPEPSRSIALHSSSARGSMAENAVTKRQQPLAGREFAFDLAVDVAACFDFVEHVESGIWRTAVRKCAIRATRGRDQRRPTRGDDACGVGGGIEPSLSRPISSKYRAPPPSAQPWVRHGSKSRSAAARCCW